MAAQSISPFLRSPWSDITGGLVSHQTFGRCMHEEMALMECLEAYGMDRGLKKCQGILEDFRECHTLQKQLKRFIAMRRERARKIKEGLLTGDNQYVSPKVDSY